MVDRNSETLAQAINTPPADAEQRTPSYEALLLIAQSVCGALERAGITDCDDPGEAIDVLRERYESQAKGVSEVTQQLIERDQSGRAKYGTTLDRRDLSPADWLQHMAEELMDAAGYALAAKREMQAQGGGEAAPVAWRTRHRDVEWSFTTKPHPGDIARGIWQPLYTAPPSAPVGVAEAWQEGYRQGVLDERSSDDNIGIAGFGAKEPRA